MSHTPGSWTVEEPASDQSEQREIMAPYSKAEKKQFPHSSGKWIASVRRYSTTTERDANARLIAAAPEMLAACEALIRGDNLQRAIDIARVVLAKVGRS